MHYVIKGAILGFLIAAPVGPIGLLCIARTLRCGWVTGFLSGLGAATSDAAYAAVAAFGMKAIITAITSVSAPLHIVGSVVLCWMGVAAMRSAGVPAVENAPHRGGLAAYGSTVFLTLVNPATIISFVAVFGSIVGKDARSAWSAPLLTMGVFGGSTVWWVVLASATAMTRRVMPLGAIRLVRVGSGWGLIAFALYALVSR